MEKIGIIDVGGGLRGIYGAAVFDYCLEENIDFDCLIGVSAGSANCAAFLGKQHGRNIRFYVKYSYRPEYMSFRNFLKTGNYLDLEYIYGYGLSNSNAEDPFDYETMIHSGKEFKIVATDALTARPIYFDMHDMKKDDYGAIKGSSCVPIVSKPYPWKNHLLYDGGLSDPIPFDYAFAHGCDRVVIILTRPKSYRRDPKNDEKMVRLLKLKNPMAAEALANRAQRYNRELDRAIKLEDEGKVLIVAPSDIEGMKTLTKDRRKLKDLYQKGHRDARKIPQFLHES